MVLSRFICRLSICALLIIAAGCSANPAGTKYQPRLGEPGRDVMWLPTCSDLVDQMLDMAKVTDRDSLIDLGSGDGRLVITATKRGAHALGIEYNANLVELSKQRAAAEGVSDKARFIKADIFESDFTPATVITMFLLDEINLQLRPRILSLKPGTRIVSNTFTMGEWKPDKTATLEKDDCTAYNTALLWIVPARVEGVWTLSPGSGELALGQMFQNFSGTLKQGGRVTPVTGKLNGDLITFSTGNVSYTGRVNGSVMEGTVDSGGRTSKWSAVQSQ